MMSFTKMSIIYLDGDAVSTNIYGKIGKNIKGLRKACGQTLLDLAVDIGIEVSTISQYETGKRVPQRDIISKIAKHFRITESELIHGDFSHMKDMTTVPVNNKRYNAIVFDKFFPVICTDEAMKNDNFKKGYQIHIKLYDLLLKENVFDDSQISLCLELYKKSYEEGIEEGIANSLWWIMFFGFICSVMNPRIIAKIERLQGKEATVKDIISGFLYSFDDEQDEENVKFEKVKAEYIKENQIEMLVDIALLKKSKLYADLGDFYLAMRYIFGLLDNDMSPEMNSAIGFEMMHTFKVLGNQYAIKFSESSE